MRILFATAHPHTPQIAGGSQASTHQLALRLRERGHDVSVLAGIYHKDFLGLRNRAIMKLTGRKVLMDRRPGYPTYRKWFPWEDVAEVLDRTRPDVVAVTAGQPVRTAKAFAAEGARMTVYFRDVEFDRLGGDPRDLPPETRYLANSEFTASAFREKFGIDPVAVPPLFMREKYVTETTRENVTFINPHPKKGRDIAFDVAEQCPDIPFAFVEGWPLDPEDRQTNVERSRRAGNVTLVPRTNDMRTVYSKARIVLIPSRWAEAWGRIASEAHFSGIPTIASKIGGLPESSGDGGLLIGPEAGADEWAAAVRRLWDDKEFYETMRRKAIEYSRRPAIDPEHQLDTIERVMTEASSLSGRSVA